jgi:hypothetical protein
MQRVSPPNKKKGGGVAWTEWAGFIDQFQPKIRQPVKLRASALNNSLVVNVEYLEL